MTSAHLFAHCAEALCIAEDSVVSFYAARTLKKFHVHRLNGARICGLFIESKAGGTHVLHVIDAENTWFTLGLQPVTLISSATLQLAAKAPEVARDTASSSKPLVGRSRGGRVPPETATRLTEAHFHQAGGTLHAVLLTPGGVYEAVLRDADEVQAKAMVTFPLPLTDCTLAVGVHTGLVVVGQRGQRWFQHIPFSAPGTREAAALRRILPVPLHAMACSPVSDAVAVGGPRGELVVYPAIGDPHHFADHWHHTALTGISFAVDGSALYTGAMESILLVWNLSSYTHRKVPCHVGPIRCIVPSVSSGSTLLLACAESTVASVDLLQLRLSGAVEGVEWSSGEACRGILVEQWMGQPAVLLTGLPNVLRVCDPLTQQAVYSLHVSSQMETIPSPPRHGIQFAGMLQDNRTLVTYETFSSTALPALLRFWAYDAATKQHVESQTVYSPHASEVRSLQVDKTRSRVFTLSADGMKCWEEVVEDANDALATATRNWRNQSTSPTPSHQVESMVLAADGSVCFVADDSVYVYDTAVCRPGERWQLLLTLTQSVGVHPLQELHLLSGGKVVAGRDDTHVFLWNLEAPQEAILYQAEEEDTRIHCFCAPSPDRLWVAAGDRSLTELSGAPANLGAVTGRARDATPHALLHMAAIPGSSHRIAVVDPVSGFRVLQVSMSSAKAVPESFEGTAAGGAAKGAEPLSLSHYFTDAQQPFRETRNPFVEGLSSSSRAARANRWLMDILKGPAYTAPSLSSLLSLYLQRRNGVSKAL